MRTTIVNVVVYQVGWFACVLGAAHGHPWLGAGIALGMVGVHLALVGWRGREMVLLAAAGCAGIVADSTLVRLGLLGFSSGVIAPGFAPPWIAVMWVQFATTFHFSARWLMERPALSVVLGAVGGPLAYEAGRRLGAVRFDPGWWSSAGALAVVWSLVLPALLWLARRSDPPAPARRYRLVDPARDLPGGNGGGTGIAGRSGGSDSSAA